MERISPALEVEREHCHNGQQLQPKFTAVASWSSKHNGDSYGSDQLDSVDFHSNSEQPSCSSSFLDDVYQECDANTSVNTLKGLNSAGINFRGDLISRAKLPRNPRNFIPAKILNANFREIKYPRKLKKSKIHEITLKLQILS